MFRFAAYWRRSICQSSISLMSGTLQSLWERNCRMCHTRKWIVTCQLGVSPSVTVYGGLRQTVARIQTCWKRRGLQLFITLRMFTTLRVKCSGNAHTPHWQMTSIAARSGSFLSQQLTLCSRKLSSTKPLAVKQVLPHWQLRGVPQSSDKVLPQASRVRPQSDGSSYVLAVLDHNNNSECQQKKTSEGKQCFKVA